MDDILGSGSYPEPSESKTKTIQATVILNINVEFDVPESWDRDEIISYIKSEKIYKYDYIDEEVVDVDL